jgi:hypothetical protein
MRVVLFIFLLAAIQANGQHQLLPQARQWFKDATSDIYSCNKLVDLNQPNTVLVGYKACGTMMLANHGYNPFVKLSYFKEGKNALEDCISKDPENIELRYLRFAIQSNAPTFLNYTSSIEKDKVLLLSSLANLKDVQLKQMIVSILLSSEHVTVAEKQYLKLWKTT